MKFCGQCATSLAFPSSSTSGVAQVEPTPLYAERRQLTVMFCDLVESTPLTELLDPEELHQVISAYQGMCFDIVSRLEGYTAQYLGDGLLVYFGYPRAHEDDVARAIRTGLNIVQGLQQLNRRLQEEVAILRRRPLQIRIGIHTGVVVVSEMGKGERRELMALGEAPNIANRLQKIAEPDSVVVSAVTQRLAEGLFLYQALGEHELRGVSALVPVYRVLGESEVRNRFEVAISRGLTTLVGRTRSIELLSRAWEHAREGKGGVILLSGEPGIGKSRLVQTLKEQSVSEPYLTLELHCSPYHQHSVLYPVIDFFQRTLGFTRNEAPEARLQKLEELLDESQLRSSTSVESATEARSLLAALLSLPVAENRFLLQLTPQRQKQKTLEVLANWVLALTEIQPVLVIVEDLHWVDASTLELLDLLFAKRRVTRLLTVLTYRSEFNPPWASDDYFMPLSLDRLSLDQSEALVRAVARGRSLPAEVVTQVVRKADGVPLFLEELTKTVLESGLLREHEERFELTGPLRSLSIPATLQDSLMARLDRLTGVKEVAQLGAVLGREFSYELIQMLFPDEAVLQTGLTQLVDAELVYQRGTPPNARYFFKHALIQDAAYQSLLKGKRRQIHLRIVQMLEQRFPELAETRPELFAHHYTQAERPRQAIPYWQRAGMLASDRAAHADAIQHFSTALELVSLLPEEPDRDRLELALQVSLGLSLAAGKGYAAPEVHGAYERALALCNILGETTELFPVLRGLWAFYAVLDDQKTARKLAEQCFRLAQDSEHIGYRIEGYTALGYSLCYAGELVAAREMLESGVVLYELHRQDPFPLLTPQDPGVACLALSSWVLWLLGYPQQALQRGQEAIALARRLEHPFHIGFAHSYNAFLHVLRREPKRIRLHAQATVQVGEDYGLDTWTIIGAPYIGIADAWQGNPQAAIETLTQSLATWQAVGIALNRAYLLEGLAEAYRAAGQFDRALETVTEAIAHVERHDESFYLPALYHLRGELVLDQAPTAHDEAETYFRQAASLASAQEAKSLELRATVSLCRLLANQGKRYEARSLLQPIYEWFTEGFDTRDLQEAGALLAELT
jgi:class 3 adenylate cyclase/predicted ATPase